LPVERLGEVTKVAKNEYPRVSNSKEGSHEHARYTGKCKPPGKKENWGITNGNRKKVRN